MKSRKSKRFHWQKGNQAWFTPPDWWILFIVLLLTAFGMLMIYDASAVNALRNFNDRFHFLREQFKWAILGNIILIGLTFFPYKKLYNLALPLLVVTLVMLVAVFIPGLGLKVLGARRWLNLIFFSIQPAEFAKLSIIIYLAAWFSNKERGRLAPFILLLVILVGLVVVEPDLGTAVVILAISAILYFFSGVSVAQIAILSPIFIGLLIFLSAVSPYRFNRLMTFFNLEKDPLGTSYHMRQVLISLGSGGWFGMGLGKSLQKYDYLPEATTDSIFAIIGEELGFAGAIVIISIFATLIIRGFKVASRAPDLFGRLLALGIVSWLGIQTIVNMSTMVSLLPLTGIPLPLISYGGSSLVSVLAGIGILLNISRSAR